MKQVVDEVPNIAPAAVAPESAKRAFPIRGSLPFSSRSFALFVTPTKVPAVSKTSTRSKVSMTLSIDSSRAATISIWSNTLSTLGGDARIPLNSTSPASQPAIETVIIPTIIAPLNPDDTRAAIKKRPINAMMELN